MVYIFIRGRVHGWPEEWARVVCGSWGVMVSEGCGSGRGSAQLPPLPRVALAPPPEFVRTGVCVR